MTLLLWCSYYNLLFITDVHTLLSDLLPSEAYFRFNPYMSEEFLLNEIQEDKLQQMQFDTQLYLRRNASKVNMAGQRLKLQRTTPQKMQDWVMDKYSVFSSGSSKVWICIFMLDKLEYGFITLWKKLIAVKRGQSITIILIIYFYRKLTVLIFVILFNCWLGTSRIDDFTNLRYQKW